MGTGLNDLIDEKYVLNVNGESVYVRYFTHAVYPWKNSEIGEFKMKFFLSTKIFTFVCCFLPWNFLGYWLGLTNDAAFRLEVIYYSEIVFFLKKINKYIEALSLSLKYGEFFKGIFVGVNSY